MTSCRIWTSSVARHVPCMSGVRRGVSNERLAGVNERGVLADTLVLHPVADSCTCRAEHSGSMVLKTDLNEREACKTSGAMYFEQRSTCPA